MKMESSYTMSPLTNSSDVRNATYVYPFTTLMLSITSSSASMIGGVVIIATYIILHGDIGNFTRKLLVALTIADFLTAFGIWVSVIRYFNLEEENVKDLRMEDVLCKLQSFLTIVSSVASFFLTSFIAVYLFDTVINQTDRFDTNQKKWLLFFNLISWTIPGLIAIIAMANNVLGGDDTPTAASGPWCWIAVGIEHGNMWRLFTGKGWEILCYLITTSLYVLLKFHIYIHHRGKSFTQIPRDGQTPLRDEDKNFLYVWLILYIIRLWGTLRFLLNLGLHPSHEEDYMKVLMYMQALGDPAQAFCNFLLFCVFDKTVRTETVKKIKCCLQKTMDKNSCNITGTEEELLIQDSHSHYESTQDLNTSTSC